MPKSDVLVLGGGVIGLSCALHLLREGRSVTVLEQNTVGSAASHGNCGTITPSLLPLPAPGLIPQALRWMLAPDSPLLIRPTLGPERLRWLLAFAARCTPSAYTETLRIKLPLLLEARRYLEQFVAAERLDCEFQALGHLNVFRSAPALEQAEQRFKQAAEFGLLTHRLDGEQARALEPALNASVIGALHNPGDAQLRPDALARALAAAVRASGGTLIEHCAVTGFVQAQGRLSAVQTAQGEHRAAEVLLALGAWSPLLARQLKLRLPVQPGKGYSITYERPARCPRIPLVLKERSVCVTSWASAYRLGSTMEFAGYDARLNRARLEALRRAAADYLVEAEGPRVLEEWQGWRPMTPDDLPILGRAPTFANLWLATGHGMLGVTLSALSGLLMSQRICGRAPAIDLAPFSVERFS